MYDIKAVVCEELYRSELRSIFVWSTLTKSCLRIRERRPFLFRYPYIQRL